jgi:Leucine-rich repeat (LRR) protein
MGSVCASKKSVMLITAKSPSEIRTKDPAQELAELKQLFEEESAVMNRRVKSCFEQVFSDEASQVSEINMKFLNLGETGALHLAKVLPFFTALKSLRLWKTKLGIEGAKLLGAVLPRLPQLSILSLEDNEMKAEGASYIANNLGSLTDLRELYLHVNKMGQEGVRALSSALAAKSTLRILTIDENQIGRTGLVTLLGALEKSLHELTLLGLAFNQLGDEGAQELLLVFKRMTGLKKMTLSGNNITPAMESQLVSAAPTVDFLF